MSTIERKVLCEAYWNNAALQAFRVGGLCFARVTNEIEPSATYEDVRLGTVPADLLPRESISCNAQMVDGGAAILRIDLDGTINAQALTRAGKGTIRGLMMWRAKS